MEEAMLQSCSHTKWQQRQQIINNLLPKFLNNLESFSHSASARQGQLLLLLTCQHVAQLLATIENMLHKKRKTKSRSQCQLWKMTRQLFQLSFLGVSCTQTIILTLMRFVTPSIVFTVVVVVAALNFKISWYFELTQLLFNFFRLPRNCAIKAGQETTRSWARQLWTGTTTRSWEWG